MVRDERRIYGSTGEIGVDGILTPDQFHTLNRLQERASNTCMQYLDEMYEGDPYPMVAMATGIGKGNIIHRVIERQMRKKPDSKVLLVAGTKLVLVKQTHEALSQYQQVSLDNNFDYVESEEDDAITDDTASVGSNPLVEEKSFLYRTGKLGQQDANVHVATIQTVQSETRKQSLKPEEYDLVIVDEVHNIGTKARKETIKQFKKVVGFTATPHRHSGTLKTPGNYGFKVIESLPLPEAQELRLLPPLVGIQIDTKGVIDEIPTTLTGAIDFKILEKLLKESPDLHPYIADRIANIISTEDGRKYKTVVAVNFVWEAQELAELLKEKGISVGVAVNNQAAKQIHTEEIPALDSLERYKLPQDDKRSIQVLISPYVASEGFDAPFTEVLVWASPTDSAVRYTQYTGRLARRAEGKLFGVVVDCLYQTNQYSWSYNMGMWMKGSVQQLENGMLWLGPETDIENLKQLPQIEALRRQADFKGLDDLQKQGVLEVQPDDFVIGSKRFRTIFMGSYKKLSPIAEEVLSEIAAEDEELVKKRRSASNIVTVVTDPQKFIERMVEKGVKLKVQTVLPTDFVLSQPSIMSTFVGDYYETLSPLISRAISELQQEVPDLLGLRNQNGIVRVITDKKRFIDKLIELGAKLKSQDVPVQPNDFVISQPSINNTFEKPNSKAVQDALAEVLKTFTQEERKRGSNIVSVVTDKERFIEEMLKRKVRLKNT